ncbi:hypothetical protein HNQ77_000660 [Silvibacterium bohemicum]|uniref:Uncharacterized protein n=1 Tax=Silvibacterium bohemicum TaxID=1577686 RepID=A0A841JMX3_9BACT|nr:hypothetical protein [Silvibacterium bohemicum]
MRIKLKCDISVTLRWLLAFAAAISAIIHLIRR